MECRKLKPAEYRKPVGEKCSPEFAVHSMPPFSPPGSFTDKML